MKRNKKRYFVVFFDGSHSGSRNCITDGSYINRQQMVLDFQNSIKGFKGVVSNIIELSKSDFEDFTKDIEQ